MQAKAKWRQPLGPGPQGPTPSTPPLRGCLGHGGSGLSLAGSRQCVCLCPVAEALGSTGPGRGICSVVGLSLSPVSLSSLQLVAEPINQVLVFLLAFTCPSSPSRSCPCVQDISPCPCRLALSPPCPMGGRGQQPGELLWPCPAGRLLPKSSCTGAVLRGRWELGVPDDPAPFSLSLFSSQDLKFNYISKEINFNVTLPMPV